MERSSELIDLINEIDNLKAEIYLLKKSRKSVKQTIENVLANLRELQDVSDNITELLRCNNILYRIITFFYICTK